MTESTPGREPVQIVEMYQPKCGNDFGCGSCRAGLGTTDAASTIARDFANGAGEWTGTRVDITEIFGGLNIAANDADPLFHVNPASTGFDGDDFRYVVVCGRLNWTPSNHEWTILYGNSGASIASSRSMTALNLSTSFRGVALNTLESGDEFVAVFDASDSTDYATEWQGQTVTRLRFDISVDSSTDFDIHSIAICDKNLIASEGTECFRTRATCRDHDRFRFQPESLFEPDQVLKTGDVVTVDGTARANDIFAAAVVNFGTDPDGVIWEQGAAATGSFLGVTSGNIVWRVGDGASGTPANGAKVSTSASPYDDKSGILFAAANVSENSCALWFWDDQARTVTLLGENTASGSFTDWAGTADGGIGHMEVNQPAGESTADFTGSIGEVRLYHSTSAPRMDADFVTKLWFSRGNLGDRDISDAPYIIPSLRSVSTTPTRINLSTANRDAAGLGNRAVCNLSFEDHPHTDARLDPYLVSRSYTPLTQGSFWSKWMVRNKYRYNMLLRVYEGYNGQTLAQMRNRSYILTNASGPGSDGRVTLQGKDVLAKLEERKAQAPEASPGGLYADLTDSATSFTVAGAALDDYEQPSGTVRINDELMTYTGVATGVNGVDFTGVTRETDGTTAAAHSTDDIVQRCIRYTSEKASDITIDLLTNWAGVGLSNIDAANFGTEQDNYLAAYTLSAVLSVPTAVTKLISELQEQVGFYIWWDERLAKVKMKAVRGLTDTPETLTEENNIMAGSFSIADMPKSRISQYWLYYNLREPTLSLSDSTNFANVNVQADLPSETPAQYGEKSVKKVFSRWLSTSALALSTASKTITRYADVPRQCSFRMDAKDRAYWVGDTVQISHSLDVDEYGQRRKAIWTIISAEEKLPGEVVEYVAEDTTLYGGIAVIQAGGSPDYFAGASTFKAWIGDASGLLSDGSDSTRIS